jgi:hypothetical protein
VVRWQKMHEGLRQGNACMPDLISERALAAGKGEHATKKVRLLGKKKDMG